MAAGIVLALRYLRGARASFVAIAHGLLGAGGLACLIVALRGPRRGEAMGVGSFGTAAAVLFAAALAIGPFIPLARRHATRFAGPVIAAHASVAITAFVLFLAWASFG